MPDRIKIVLKLTSTFFDNENVPKPLMPFELTGGKFVFEFKDKEQLKEYTGKLYAQYAKFENPQTGLIADLLTEIASQITQD
jgi:hypothetical protein